MNFRIHIPTIGVLLLATLAVGSLHAAGKLRNGHLPERPEGRPAKKVKDADNPGARARWMDMRYNENYLRSGGKASSGPQHGGVWSPRYQRFMMAAAKRERLRYASKMPVSGTSKAVLDPSAPITARAPSNSLNRDLRWTNLGPTKANFLRNGSFLLNATDTGRINAIETDPANPNTIYLAFSGGGLWKTTNGGASWQAKTETLGSLSVGSFALDPNNPQTMYLGLGDPFDGTGLGIVKMTQGGDAWEDPVFLGSSSSIRKILVAPSNSNIVLVATNQGLFRSTNAGKTYAPIPVNTGVTDIPAIWSLAHGGGDTIVMSLEATPTASNNDPGRRNGQIWRSTDNGATWALANGVTIPQGVNRISMASAPSNRSIIYAMASKPRPTGNVDRDLGTIFKSTDGGANWTSLATDAIGNYKTYTNPNADYSSIEELLGGQGWYNQAIVVDRTNPDIVYFGGALHTAKTSDGGQSYTILTEWLADFSLPYVHADAHSAHISSNGTLYFGTDGGIFASSNGGASFTDTLNEGIAAHLVYNVCSTPANNDRILMGLQDNGSRLREGNGGIFNQVVGGDGFACNVNPVNANTMLATVQYLGIRKSVNGGSTFFNSCTGLPECSDADKAPFQSVIAPWAGDASGNTLYTYITNKVYRTTDYASNWTALGTTGLPADLFIRGIGVARTSGTTPNNDSVVGIVANGGRVYLSTDGGANWARQSGQLPNNGLSLNSIAFDPVDRNIIYVSSVAPESDRAHLWRSTNFGASWATIDGNGFPSGIPVNQIVVDPTVRTTLYAATHLGAYRSLDSGTNWERLGSFLPLVEVTDITVLADGNRVRAATFGRGVWELAAIGANVAPVANFTVANSGLTATFTDTSTDSDGTIVRRQWNFGDGVNSSSTNPLHTYAAPGTYTVQLVVTDNAGYTHSRSVSVTVTDATGSARNDIDGDGRSDLIWHQPQQGLLNVWLMNGTTISGSFAKAISPLCTPRAVGDLNGDGRADVIWICSDSGVYLWQSTGNNFTQLFIGGFTPGWDLVAARDANADGRDDLIWHQPQQGLLNTWLMNGTTISGSFAKAISPLCSPKGYGDLNGDGRSDVTWICSDSGVYLWQSTGSSYDQLFISGFSPGWTIVTAKDANGDGRDDLIWHNADNGLLNTWLMNGTTISGSFAKALSTLCSPGGYGDHNGDGRSDVSWVCSDSGVYQWRSTGSNYDQLFVGGFTPGWSLLKN